ncbi:hypothetical protein ILYODFUR_028564, partial [Ilyodon furcidens]
MNLRSHLSKQQFCFLHCAKPVGSLVSHLDLGHLLTRSQRCYGLRDRTPECRRAGNVM